ncbi:DUF5067 domain-containing protein [Staphylococcus hominis]|uniref:DUF5067 domain-containing protein n=1 Tax=Staphylococcus hominis TaxID=1290 RepID=UPI000D1F6273|nr:DUF5067 domain-containing protein [Staphylococcus hominis]PTK22488.1 DUF5067 domain-containing protein [Staphylococcus hominis]PTK25162.1 DUF5067 domain-containing protein [Staphylococcus hominis]RIO53050.1 DUF5067 domain-containing protein [Staphylococcus hominis]
MKKFLALIFSGALILGACGNDDTTNDKQQSNDTETKSVNENKAQFKDDTLVIDQAVLKIDDTFIINDKDSDDKLLAFKFHVKNKTNSEDITPTNVWIACFEATQDSENTVNKLDVGFTPTTGKFEEWDKHNNDAIKKGKTAKGIITYTLQNDEDVTLKATKGASGKKLGTKEIDLDDLKSEDYSLTGDLSDNSGKNDDDQVIDDNKEDNDSKNQTVANTNDENTNSTKETTNNNDTNKNDDVSKTLNDNGQKEVAVSTQNSKETSSVPAPNQSSNNTSDESQQVDNGPSRQQYEEAQTFTKDVKENPDNYGGVGGGPALTSDAGESYDQYKQRVQETE